MPETTPSTREPRPLRRLVAATLMLVFLSPLVLHLFAASAGPESSLPACCRRHGKHHCTMTMEMMAMLAASSGPVLTSPPCPLYPAAATPVRIVTAYFAALPPLSIEIQRDPSPPAPTLLRICTLSITSNCTRGPPARLA
jgi:hypothetical protein